MVDFDFGDYVSGSTWEGIPYGPELITNGDFATDSDWTKGAGWTISAGSATHTGGVASYLSQDVLTPNSLYKVEIEVLQADGSNFIQIYMGTSPALETITAAGSYTFSLTSQPVDNIGFSIRGIGNAKVDNISVRNIPVFTLEGNASVFQPPVDASGPFGYLAEKASTNLLLNSSNLYLSKLGVLAGFRVGTASVVPASTQLVASFYLKPKSVGRRTIAVNTDAYAFPSIATAGLTQGVWTRVETETLTGTGGAQSFLDLEQITATTPTYTENAGIAPDGTLSATEITDGTYTYEIWGAQLEQGTYPTSYIATTTTAVTRNADVLIAGDMVTDAAGSGYAEVSSNWSTAIGANYQALCRDGNGQILVHQSVGQPSDKIYVYDGTNQSFVGGANYYKSVVPAASTWGNALTAYLNGSPDLSPAAYDGTMGTGNLGIGNTGAGVGLWDGTIREVKIFDSELTAAEVGDL